VRAIGGGTNALQYWECMSKDNGTNAPGIANFALARLILGQSATGAVAQAKLALRDQYDNNTVDATPEVLYVSNLLMYAHSTLYLDGLKLLYFNGSAWTQAVAGVFAGGDGTGSIGASSLVSLANIGNGAATNVTVSTATLTGTLWDEGSGQTLVSVFWGLTNGTTNAAAWAHTNTFTGYQTTGAALSTNIVLDTPNRFYYYRFYATNSSGEAWAPVSSFFQAAPITIVATTPEASEENTVPGVFTVTRAGSLTNEAVTVNYTVSGTAGNGVDYTTLSGAVPLGAGQASATIVVTPIMDATNEPDETAIVTLTAGAYALGSPSNATVTIHNNSNLVWYCALTNGQTGNWSASATWTNVGGLIGVPTLSDTAVINDLPSGSFTLGLDPGWGAKNLFLNSASAVQHFLSLASDGYVKSLTWNSSSPAGYVGLFWEGGGYKVTVDQFRNVGPNVPNGRWIGGSGAYLFTNAAQIVYHTTNATDLACLADFGGASSVHLARSTALGTTTMETLGAQSANAQPPTYIGRRDNGVQTWTVGAGNHPLLRAQNAYGYSLAKVGTNHVDMSDVDLWCVCAANVSYGISSSGAAAGAGTALYQGEIRANSLTFTRTESATVYTQSFDIVGALVLDGQGGLQAGGTGNGRAFSLVSNTNGQTRLRFGSHSSPGNAGLAKRAQVSITPAGGEFYLNGAAPAGSIKWEIYNTAAERTNATLIANTINLASPRAVINDRDPQNDTDANAGGTLEFRGDFVSQCTDTNNFRMEFSTVRTIGGLTNEVQYWECMSQDLGAVPAGFTNNFALGRLVLGQTSAGATAKADLVLRNQSDNNLADALAEAVYVTNLTMYANSCLYLNGFNLYYKNGGSWQRAVPGAFAPGDGTGRIREIWPVPSGTTFKFR
jgi:hypothetical protein